MVRKRTSKESSDEKLKIEYVSLEDLKRWPRNPKEHDIPLIGESINRFGFINPLLVDEKSGKLVAGHGRLDSLLSLKQGSKKPPKNVHVDKDGKWFVPVVRGVKFKDSKEAQAFVVADNRVVEVGGWDEEKLAGFLKEIADTLDGFNGIGYDADDYESLLAFVTMTGDEESPIPEMEGFEPPERAFRIIITCKDENELRALHKQLGIDEEKFTKVTFSYEEITGVE